MCYDYASGSVVWQIDVAKHYSFRAIARTDGACAAIVPQNFAKRPIGMFRFDIKSGDAIAPDSAVSGWKVQYVDAGAGAFFFSWVDKETSFMRAVGARDGTVRERSFPYHSTGGGKTIERVLATGENTFIAFFGLVDGNRVAFSIESWTLDSAAPAWEARTLRNVIRNGEVLVGWENAGKKLEIQIFSAKSGQQETSFRVKVPNVVCIQPIDANTYAILAISGVYVMRADTQSIAQLPGMSSSDFLDFGSLAVDASAGKLLVATAGNYGACMAYWPTSQWLWIGLSGVLFVRMALNAIDGMLAREFNQQSVLGGYLNELSDVISDALLYLRYFYFS